MEILKAIKNRRTIRQFEDREIPQKVLKLSIDAARLAPSARNRQPLEYIVVTSPKIREKVFETLSWGGKLPKGAPAENQRAGAYVLVLANSKINPNCDFDVGLAVENLVLAAFSQGLGSCILGAVDRDKLKKLCHIPEDFEIKLVVALGYPAEKSMVEDVDEPKEYWRDDKNILHIPKRKLAKIIHFDKF